MTRDPADLQAVLQGAGVCRCRGRRHRSVSGARDRDEPERIYRGALQRGGGHGGLCEPSGGEILTVPYDSCEYKIISKLLLF